MQIQPGPGPYTPPSASAAPNPPFRRSLRPHPAPTPLLRARASHQHHALPPRPVLHSTPSPRFGIVSIFTYMAIYKSTSANIPHQRIYGSVVLTSAPLPRGSTKRHLTAQPATIIYTILHTAGQELSSRRIQFRSLDSQGGRRGKLAAMCCTAVVSRVCATKRPSTHTQHIPHTHATTQPPRCGRVAAAPDVAPPIMRGRAASSVPGERPPSISRKFGTAWRCLWCLGAESGGGARGRGSKNSARRACDAGERRRAVRARTLMG